MTGDILPERPRGVKLSELYETPTATDITNVFHLCHADGELGLVTGEPGVGKTSAARRYVAGRADAYLITMSPASSTLVPSLVRIGEAVRAYPSGTSGSAWSDAIRKALSYEPDPQVLLIDEAQHMSDASAEEIRAIYDAISIGVVFIGNRDLRDRWSGKRWAQLGSRFLHRIDLEAPLPSDIDAICTAMGVEGKRPRDLLRRAAARPGALRIVRKLLNVAAGFAGAGQSIKTEHIEAAFRTRGELAP